MTFTFHKTPSFTAPLYNKASAITSYWASWQDTQHSKNKLHYFRKSFKSRPKKMFYMQNSFIDWYLAVVANWTLIYFYSISVCFAFFPAFFFINFSVVSPLDYLMYALIDGLNGPAINKYVEFQKSYKRKKNNIE